MKESPTNSSSSINTSLWLFKDFALHIYNVVSLNNWLAGTPLKEIKNPKDQLEKLSTICTEPQEAMIALSTIIDATKKIGRDCINNLNVKVDITGLESDTVDARITLHTDKKQQNIDVELLSLFFAQSLAEFGMEEDIKLPIIQDNERVVLTINRKGVTQEAPAITITDSNDEPDMG